MAEHASGWSGTCFLCGEPAWEFMAGGAVKFTFGRVAHMICVIERAGVRP